jgi:DNA topoisomerase-1
MESSDDEPIVKKKVKKIKIKADPGAKAVKKRKREPDAVPSSSTPVKKPKTKGLKKLDKAERLQYAMQSFLWWNAKEPPEGCQWVTMEHSGVSFPETYVPHGIKMKYDGQPVDLTPAQEEA